MEIEPQTIKAELGTDFLQALENYDREHIVQNLESLKVKETPISEWAAALGMRLQIRDVFSREKGNLALLYEKIDTLSMDAIRSHLHDLDHGLDVIRGWDAAQETTQSPALLKAQRIDRLLAESTKNLAQVLLGFSGQSVQGFLQPDALLERLDQVRGNIVHWLWGAAITYNEGDVITAKAEFEEGVTAINDDLDINIQGVVDWRNL